MSPMAPDAVKDDDPPEGRNRLRVDERQGRKTSRQIAT